MERVKTLQEVEEEFKRSVLVPENKPARQFLFCPVGLVGTGKTTVTEPLSEKFNLVRVSSDEFRKLLKENGYDYSPIKDIGLRFIRDLAKGGYSIAFDMDCGNPQVSEFAKSLAQELGIPIIFVSITAPEEFVFNKFRNHPPTWLADNPQTMIDNYLAQKDTRLREGTKFDFLYTFDTSRNDLKDQLEECYKKIDSWLRD